jgi:putative hemolysin
MMALLDILRSSPLYLAALAGMALSFLASAVETGSYRLNRIRLRIRADAGDRGAAALLVLLRDLRGLIVTVLISNNLANFVVTAAVTTLVAETAIEQSDLVVEMLSTAIVAPLLFVFCELLPKNVFAFNPEARMCRLAAGVRAAYRLFSWTGLVPALKGLSTLVLRVAGKKQAAGANPFTPRQRLRALLRESAAEGVISGYQSELVEKVLALRDVSVRKVMIPLGHVVAVPLGITREQFIAGMREHSFTRLPVYVGARESIVGIVRIDDAIGAEGGTFDLSAVMSRDVLSISTDAAVSQAMFRMRKARAAMAVVRDSRNGAVGIITIKDLVEEVVGELGAW